MGAVIGHMSAEMSPQTTCSFNPWCTCSRSNANLGTVICVNIPLLKVPAHLNYSKMNTFYLKNNGLKMIEPHFLSGTGLHVLKISRNPIHSVPTDSFKGLENTLRELELSYLNLAQVPHASLYYLQKLQKLNLAGNHITDVNQNVWINVRNTLETLILRENAIAYVPSNAFERFADLRVLDLSMNVLVEIDSNAFFPDTRRLEHLYLADNQLHFIPYTLLQHLSALRTLDLSRNFITQVEALSESTTTEVDAKFSLNVLNLKYNDVKTLSVEDFSKFEELNYTYLDGNPITMIQADTFRNVKIRELSFSNCGLISFHVGMIRGLEESLVALDVSYNNLRILDANIFRSFNALRQLKLSGNTIENFAVPDRNGNIVDLDVMGNENTNYEALLYDISNLMSLIRISISNIEIPYIAANHFIGYSSGIEELTVRNAYLKSIHDQAFTHIRGLKKLNLNNNEITHIDERAFAEIGHSLEDLYLANAFATSVKILPHSPLKYLRNLRKLDVSRNHFEQLPANTLLEMHELEIIRIHDCQLKTLEPGTFQTETHQNLKEATFSFNQLSILKRETFSDLPELQYLNIEDNLIETIESRALNNLKKLKWIYLRGNRIDVIQKDAFANLPELELLDLAYNNLKNFHLACLDTEVGSSASLTLNLTYNNIYALHSSKEMEFANVELNIKIMDLSYNNISDISVDYFTALESSLTHLYLTQNFLNNASEEIFGNLVQLQWLDVSRNRLKFIRRDTSKDINAIQILNFNQNDLMDIQRDFFSGMKSLRIVDLSDNRLTTLPEYSFRENSLEKVLLARNEFAKLPFKSLSPEVAKSLKELDISHNKITSIHSLEFLSLFESLVFLNISDNRLTRVDESLFFRLANLLYLDLSHNSQLQFADAGRSFTGVQENLVYLRLNNISLVEVPDLPFPKLTYLYLSANNLSTLTLESVMNLTSVRVLDLSWNNLTSLPVELLSMKSLRMLDISNNHIRVLCNNSLLNGLEQLDELDITQLPLTTFETGALSRLSSLTTLHITTYADIGPFNIPRLLGKNKALRHLRVDVTKKYLNSEMFGTLPKKLQRITINGHQLDSLDSKILQGVSSTELDLIIDGTNVRTLNNDLLRNMQKVKNITLDVRRNSLKYLANPTISESSYFHNRTLLLDVKVSSNPWSCDCDVGWIETWQRMRRQILCSYLELSSAENTHACMKTTDDLRETVCKNGKLLLQTMKVELECGWSRSSYGFQVMNFEYLFIIFLAHIWERVLIRI